MNPSDPNDPSPIRWEMLDRYFAGEADPQEAELARAYLRQRAGAEKYLRDAVTYVGPPEAGVVARVPEWGAMLQRLARESAGAPSSQIPSRSRGIPMRNGIVWLALLVVVGVIGGIGRVWMRGRQSSPATLAAYHTVATKNGQIARLTLADGSQVTLAPNSTLGIRPDFAAHRELVLTGEAYFDVHAVTGAPFLVRTGNVVTRVLGTRFDVTHYANDRHTRVVVTAGKVAVSAPRQVATVVVAGTMGDVTDSTAVIAVTDDAAGATEWTQGRLRFRNVRVTDVLARLSQWYGVDFRIMDSTLAHKYVTTELGYRDTQDVVVALEHLLDVTATDDSGTTGRPVVVLRPRSSATRTGTQRIPGTMRELLQTEVGR